MKYLVLPIVIPVLLVIGIVAYAVLKPPIIASHPPVPVANSDSIGPRVALSEGPTPGGGTSNSTKSLWERITEDQVAFVTFLLVIVTGGLTISTVGLWIVTWRSGIRQSDDMQASIAAAQRSAISRNARSLRPSEHWSSLVKLMSRQV
jgi:hypothetical protein